jgi:serine/threonine-protein kinase
MAIDSSSALVAAIRAACLLDTGQLEQVETAFQGRFSAPVDLARHLMRSDWLTPYQVNQLLQGNGAMLLLGPYVLLERLGAGGMGEVFKARHRRLQRIDALKIIRKQRLESPNVIARFRREVEAAAQLSHPNIVTVYNAGEEQDIHYLAMELIDGIDLGKLVRQCGPLPVAQACDYARQAALGLHHAHERGLVHRDVKPQNLLVAAKAKVPAGTNVLAETYAGGTVKVLDMGLVRYEPDAGPQTEGALTQLGVVIGTIDYLAPEQAKNSHRVDRRADLYSLGCTLYYLLAGAPPFPDGAAMDKLLKHQIDAPPPITKLRPDVSTEVSAIVHRLLAKRREDRYSTAGELAAALAAVLPRCPGTAPPPVIAVAPVAPSSGPAGSGLQHTFLIEPSSQLAEPTTNPPEESAVSLFQPVSPRTSVERRRLWIAGAAGLALTLVLVAVAAVALRRPAAHQPAPSKGGRDEPPTKQGPAALPDQSEALADYLPPGCAGVVALNVKQMLSSEVRKPHGRLGLAPPVRDVLGLLGIDPERDVEWVRVCLRAGKDRRHLVIGRGKVTRSRLKLGGEGRLEPITDEGRPLHYQLRGPDGPVYFGLAPPYVLVSQNQNSVVAGLNHAERHKASEQQRPLPPLLANVDRRQTAWLALDLDRLKLAPAKKQPFKLDVFQKHARHLHGGITYGHDLRGRFVVEARDEKGAARLERAVSAVRDLVRDTGREREPDMDLDALARLFGTATIIRAGKVLTLSCSLPAGAYKLTGKP